MCSIVKLNESNLSIHLESLFWYVLFLLLFLSAARSGWWSVWSKHFFPYRQHLKCSNAQAMATNSSSFVMHVSSSFFRKRLPNATGFQMESCFCSKDALRLFLLVLHFTLVSFFDQNVYFLKYWQFVFRMRRCVLLSNLISFVIWFFW